MYCGCKPENFNNRCTMGIWNHHFRFLFIISEALQEGCETRARQPFQHWIVIQYNSLSAWIHCQFVKSIHIDPKPESDILDDNLFMLKTGSIIDFLMKNYRRILIGLKIKWSPWPFGILIPHSRNWELEENRGISSKAPNPFSSVCKGSRGTGWDGSR